MSNRLRGYIPIEIGGETYQLRYDFDSLARLDHRLGRSFLQTLVEGGISFHVVREALLAGLSNPMNTRGVAKVIRKLDVGKIDYYLDCIFDALEAAGVLKSASEAEADEGEA